MRYKTFGRGSGLRVSELALGGALFGTAWGYGAEAGEVRRILEGYCEAGGNFLDLADSYQCGQSETIVGDFLPGRREHLVVASKYTLGAETEAHLLSTGNSRKNMIRSVEASLQRLKTDRIDLYWVHMADGLTAVEEIVRGLDDLVRTGKILYAGFSDFPAWRVARAATIAEIRGWAPVVGLQIEYSLAERTPDRELLPMAQALGMGVAAWSPLGGGFLTGKYRRGEPGRATTFGAVVHTESEPGKTAVLDAVLAVAEEAGVSAGQVALAWLVSRGTVPIIGPRTREQLEDNLGATAVALTSTQLAKLDSASAVPLGFPHDFLADNNQRVRMAGGTPEKVECPATPVA
ncbi:MAG: aldo/keto reductase [Nevskia sp.]|nr:aldo/keto reductase [Nevskia sp.]